MNLDHFDTILAFAAIIAGLSLVITALTQAVSGLLGLRGLNLKWGLERLFRTLAPDLDTPAGPNPPTDPIPRTEALAAHILRHPLLSDSSFSGCKKWWGWWRYATHIRMEELAKVLKAWQQALGLPAGTAEENTARATALGALNVPASLRDLAPAQLDRIERGLVPWFDASMDRVSQRFTANTRIITIAGAVLLSLGLVLDSGDLWSQLSANPELRNKVIASSDALLRQADEMQVGSTNLPPTVYRLAADQLLAMHTNALAGFTGTAVITNLTSGTNWLAAQCASRGVPNLPRWLETYQALVPQAALRQAADNLDRLLEQHLSLGILSSQRPGESWWSAVEARLGGIVVSIVLLSLGAPFWFNTLRSLSNLRPVLAAKDTEADQARLKAIAAGKKGAGTP